MSVTYKLTPIVVGVFPEFPVRRFLYGFAGDDVVEAPCISWLARGSDGSTVLVDTGPPEPTDFSSTLHVGLKAGPQHRIDVALARVGLDPDEVQTVVFTHLHFDHCAHSEFLPHARVLVAREELRYAVAPLDAHRRGYEVRYHDLKPAWMSNFGRIEPIDGLTQISEGCKVLPLPGHSPGSVGVFFDTARGRYCAAGDLVSRVENWKDARGEHVAPALHSSLEACGTSFALMEREADVVLASHDYRSMDLSGLGS